MTDPAEIFEKLECNDTEIIEKARAEIYTLLQNVKDPWVINGLYDYYLNSNSLRSMEILANVNDQHHRYLFDRLTESIKRQETELKVKALTLLGHIVRKQPTWIYKIHEHAVMREILGVLKTEDNILALISALLLVIVLMPMIPSLMANHLQEVFDIFCRLAAWNLGTGALSDKQMMIHMQISLYALFLRLYGMYPCNFIAFLRSFYRDKKNPVFVHTIQPMLETVKMHPRLVTATKDNETSSERWKTVDAQQVIAECEQFYVDVIDKCPHDCCYVSTGIRSRSGTTNSTIIGKSSQKSPATMSRRRRFFGALKNFFKIGRVLDIFPDRIQAPITKVLQSDQCEPLLMDETETPKFQLEKLKDLCVLPPPQEKKFFSPSLAFPDRLPVVPATAPADIIQPHFLQGTSSHEGTSPPEAAIEATPETTPVRDTRTSGIVRSPHVGSSVVRGLTSFTKNRSANTTPTHSQPSSPMRKDASSSPFHFPSTSSSGANVKRDSFTNQRLQKLMHERSQSVDAYIEPISGITPLNVPSSPVKIVDSSRRNESPFSREDQEVESIVAQRRDVQTSPRKCDSVLHEDTNVDLNIDDNLEQGSPCSQGGLHMPNSKSMNEFAKRVQRLRNHSQNYDRDPVEDSTESSPGKASSPKQSSDSATVRRASSCPEIEKKSPVSAKDSRPLKETEEEACNEESSNSKGAVQKSIVTRETQTEDSYLPYEHLFLNIFPYLGSNDVKSSPSPIPLSVKPFGDKENQHSVTNVLDKYIEISKGDITNPTVQMQLLQQQLLFERYRRETFASRNRKLLADAKNVKSLEEYNSALKDTIQLQQKDIDFLKSKLNGINREHFEEKKKQLNHKKYLEDRIIHVQDQVMKLEAERDREKHNLVTLKEKYNAADRERQQASGSLFQAYAELNMAKEQAAMGERARAEVERLNKEILLLGELQMKYEEKLQEAAKTKNVNYEMEMIQTSYSEEVKTLKSKTDHYKSHMESYRQRVIDLEGIISQKDDGISQLKRNLMEVKAENHEKIQAVEEKYKTQLAINRALEQKMLQLYAKIELPGFRSLHSPETSSCHEAMATASVSGLSPHSSPLSVSLASSESSTAFLSSDIKDMKNLQVLVDRKAGKLEDSVESAGDTMEMFQPSTSGSQQQND